MRVWHANAERPSVTHKSVIPLPPDKITAQQEALAFEQGSDALVVATVGPKRRKRASRKKANDSVSLQHVYVSASDVTAS